MHAERFRILSERKIIEERVWNLQPDQLHKVNEVLIKHKLTYLNQQIQPVARNLVLEFYDSASVTDLESRV